jgi:hypothetical protein
VRDVRGLMAGGKGVDRCGRLVTHHSDPL